MKAQFKYAFLAGLYYRGIVFAVILVLNIVSGVAADIGYWKDAVKRRIPSLFTGGME